MKYYLFFKFGASFESLISVCDFGVTINNTYGTFFKKIKIGLKPTTALNRAYRWGFDPRSPK